VLFMGLSQHQAEATSLLAIVPVAIAGTITQDRYGNVRRSDALLIGLLSIAGAVGGVALANALPASALRIGFAVLILLVAAQLVRKTLGERDDTRGSRVDGDARHGGGERPNRSRSDRTAR
jgi:uncharacterized protein